VKKLLLILFLCAVSKGAFCQNFYLREKYEDKIYSYQIMEKAGTHLAIAGGLITAAGVFVLSNTSSGPDVNNSNDSKKLLGVLLVGKGIPVTILGLVFRTVGINAQRKYERKIDRLSIGLLPTPKAGAITLTFRF